jgi:hypothetical protein
MRRPRLADRARGPRDGPVHLHVSDQGAPLLPDLDHLNGQVEIDGLFTGEREGKTKKVEAELA